MNEFKRLWKLTVKILTNEIGGFTIDDGKGSGKSAEVDENNHLVVNSITQTIEHYINHVDGNAFNLLFAATPASTGDCFIYMKNTSDDDFSVEGIWLWLAADEYVDVKLDDTGTPVGGSAITPANLSGSGNTPTGTFQQGNNITGLSGGTTVDRIYHASSQESQSYNFDQDIILRKNGVFTMYIQTGTTALAGKIVFNIHSQA